MKLKSGDKIDELTLSSIDGSKFEIKNISNKRALVTFYRFASCPFCNLRINEIVRRLLVRYLRLFLEPLSYTLQLDN